MTISITFGQVVSRKADILSRIDFSADSTFEELNDIFEEELAKLTAAISKELSIPETEVMLVDLAQVLSSPEVIKLFTKFNIESIKQKLPAGMR